MKSQEQSEQSSAIRELMGNVDYTGHDRTIYITGDDLEGEVIAKMVAEYNQQDHGKHLMFAIKLSELDPCDPVFDTRETTDVVMVCCLPCTRKSGSMHTHYGKVDDIKRTLRTSLVDLFSSSSFSGLDAVADDLGRKLTADEELVKLYTTGGIPGLLAKGISAKKIAALVSRDHRARGITLEDEQQSLWRQIVDDSVKFIENNGAVGYIVPTICEELDRPLLDHILLHEAGKPIIIMMVNKKGITDTAIDVTFYYSHGVGIVSREYGKHSQSYEMNSQVGPRVAGMKVFNLRAKNVLDKSLPTPTEMMTDIMSHSSF